MKEESKPDLNRQEDEVHMKELKEILELEKTHLQWKKQGINLGIFVLLLFVNLFRGSKKSPYIFGVEACSVSDWSAFAAFIIVCAFIIHYSLKQN